MSDLIALARAVLQTAGPADKVLAAVTMAEAWRCRTVARGVAGPVPARPARPDKPVLMPPKHMPKRTYAGQTGRNALVHALAHIEFNAIDLACDMLCRPWNAELPDAFFDDWVQVALDEARHFQSLQSILEGWGASYGDLPAHDGLWQSAEKTAHDLLARLAVVPMTLEARGLDTTPGGIAKLRRHHDHATADALEVIYQDEIAHVAAGIRWFIHVTGQRGLAPIPHYHLMLNLYFPGDLKPPFNETARAQAGMGPDWYHAKSSA